MTLIEAIESGQPFKRPNDDDWAIPNPRYNEELFEAAIYLQGSDRQTGYDVFPFVWQRCGRVVIFSKKALIATDWEVLKQ